MSAEIWNAIAVVKDPRVQGRIDYPLELILLVSLYATISGCDDWEQIEDYANIHSEDLRNLYTKLSGKELKVSRMPTHDTFNHVFQVIDPKEFLEVYKKFIISIYETLTGKTIAIDGKTPRGIKQTANSHPSHIVSAYCTDHHFVIDHINSEVKGHELSSILDLIKLLFLENNTVTIDAAGTYVEVIEMILSKGGNFVLPVKGNQKKLLEVIEKEFREYRGNTVSADTQEDIGHGRVEKRTVYCITEIKTDDDIDGCMQKWKGVKTLVKIVREVYKKADKSTRIETVYYITNLIDPKEINRAIRAHWGIENNLHRSLDVLLNEDHSQKSNHNVVENLHIMSLLALFIIKEISKQRGISMNRTRKLCGYSSPSKLLVN